MSGLASSSTDARARDCGARWSAAPGFVLRRSASSSVSPWGDVREPVERPPGTAMACQGVRSARTAGPSRPRRSGPSTPRHEGGQPTAQSRDEAAPARPRRWPGRERPAPTTAARAGGAPYAARGSPSWPGAGSGGAGGRPSSSPTTSASHGTRRAPVEHADAEVGLAQRLPPRAATPRPRRAPRPATPAPTRPVWSRRRETVRRRAAGPGRAPHRPAAPSHAPFGRGHQRPRRAGTSSGASPTSATGAPPRATSTAVHPAHATPPHSVAICAGVTVGVCGRAASRRARAGASGSVRSRRRVQAGVQLVEVHVGGERHHAVDRPRARGERGGVEDDRVDAVHAAQRRRGRAPSCPARPARAPTAPVKASLPRFAAFGVPADQHGQPALVAPAEDAWSPRARASAPRSAASAYRSIGPVRQRDRPRRHGRGDVPVRPGVTANSSSRRSHACRRARASV